MTRYVVSCLIVLASLVLAAGLFFPDYWIHRYDGLIARQARVYRLDEKLVWSLIYEETYFRAWKIGNAEEVGLMQVTPVVAREWAKQTGMKEYEKQAAENVNEFMADPERNIQVGCWYLEKLREPYRERPAETAMTLAAYNAGPSRVEEWTKDADTATMPETDFVARINIPSTRSYVTSILERYRTAPSPNNMQIHSAEYVLPITSEPIDHGAIAIDGDKIVAVGTFDELQRQFPDATISDHGKAAILPGFVNCHSHLEITSMRGSLDDVEHDFRSWLLKLTSLRAGLTDDDICAAAVAGAVEGARAGVTCFGDIGRMGHAGVAALKQVGLRGVVFQETEFSPDNRTADDDFLKLATKYELLKAEETDLVRVGMSPHSPYTVGSRLFELIAQYAILNRVPLTIHAAELATETELLAHGTGLFRGFYEKFGLEWHSPHCTPIEYLERLGVLSTQPLLAHCVRVSDNDMSKINANGAKIAHCPKSNAKFGHGYAPFEQVLNMGITVGLDSDSVASNNVCDLLEESRFAALAARNREGSKRFITAKEMLEAVTLGGAKALGLDSEIGSLEPGKQADLAVVSLSNPAQLPISDVHTALIFASNARDVVMTMVAGRELYRTKAEG